MSLNWVEIDQVLRETDLAGAFLQNARQADFHHLLLEFHKPGQTLRLLISLEQGRTRLHPVTRKWPNLPQPPRFIQFLRAHLLGAKVLSASQLGQERLVHFFLGGPGGEFHLWIRLWGGAANVLVTSPDHVIQEAMFRRPDSGEVKGERFDPEADLAALTAKKSSDRVFALRELPGEGPYWQRLEAFYDSKQDGDAEKLRERVIRLIQGRLGTIAAQNRKAAEKLRDSERLDDFKTYGDMIAAFAHQLQKGDTELEEFDFRDGLPIIIPLDPELSPQENAQKYYKRYTKARDGRQYLEEDAKRLEAEELAVEALLIEAREAGPERLTHLAAQFARTQQPVSEDKNPRPGLEFRSGTWTLWVGRNARENDELLRRWVKGNDFWLHTRDVAGGYVFIKNQPGKSVPLAVLLDAGNLAIHYSKAKLQGQADLYYTAVKYLRRAKDGPVGMVLPTQEKNLHVKVDAQRLGRLLGGSEDKDD